MERQYPALPPRLPPQNRAQAIHGWISRHVEHEASEIAVIRQYIRGRKPRAVLLVHAAWQVLRLRVLHKAARRAAQDDGFVLGLRRAAEHLEVGMDLFALLLRYTWGEERL